MQTQPIDGRVAGTPWLECLPADGGEPTRTELGHFPFSLGRSDQADLQLESTKVSRDHAAIEKVKEGYLVSDLGSTNGTFVNGQRVDQAELTDGDMLLIADEEFSFYAGLPAGSRQTATMVIEGADPNIAGSAGSFAFVRNVRRLHEMLVHRAVDNYFQPIKCLKSDTLLGYETVPWYRSPAASATGAGAERELLGVDCRLTSRLHHLYRLIAVEEASDRLGAVRLFVPLHPDEIGSEGLTDALGKLQQATANLIGLVVEIPEAAVCNTRHFQQFHAELRNLGLAIAYDGFAYGKAQVLEQRAFPPDFLKLAESVVRGIQHNESRRQQIQSVVKASERLGAEVIATGVHHRRDADLCRKLGCRHVQGNLTGSAQIIHQLLEPSVN